MIYPLSHDFCVAKFRQNSENFMKCSGWKESSCTFGSGPYVSFNMKNGDQTVTIGITRKMGAQHESMNHVCQILQLVKNMIEMHGHEGRIVRGNKIEIIWEKYHGMMTVAVNYGHANKYMCDYDLHILWRIPCS